MQKPFQPTPGTQTATFAFARQEWRYEQCEAVHMVAGMPGVIDVYFDFDGNVLTAGFYPYCTEEMIRSRLEEEGHALIGQPSLVLSQAPEPEAEAISA